MALGQSALLELLEALQTESTISISTGIFRRPIDYMRRMVRAEYAGLRIHRDRQRLAGEVNELVDSLASDDRPVYLAQMREYWRQDDAIAEQHGPF
jgi:hypothetical protein